MTERFEGGYEDSYQKEERLKVELREAIEDYLAFLSVPRSDLDAVKESFKVIDERMKRFNELKKELDEIDEMIKIKKKEKDELGKPNFDIDEEVDVYNKITNEIEVLYEKYFEIDSMLEVLMNETDSVVVEQNGVLGDVDSSTAALRMKAERVENLQKQLKEIRDSRSEGF